MEYLVTYSKGPSILLDFTSNPKIEFIMYINILINIHIVFVAYVKNVNVVITQAVIFKNNNLKIIKIIKTLLCSLGA